MTRGELAAPDGVLVAHGLDDALVAAAAAPDVERVFVVGGGQLYREALAHARLRWST